MLEWNGPDIGLHCLPMYHKTMFVYCRLIIFANMLEWNGPDIGLHCLPMYHKTMFVYCRLIIFANMLDPYQARYHVTGLIWIQTVCTLMVDVASGLNCLCPTKRIENSKLAVGFTPQFLCESSLFAEVHL